MTVSEVFTTLRVVHGRPVWLKEHLARLHTHAKAVGFKIPPAPLFQRGGRANCLLRIGLSEMGYSFQERPLPTVPRGPVRVHISDQIATSQLKTNERAVYNEAFRQAKAHGAFEGLLLNQEGYVVDGSRSSLILQQGNTLISLQGGIDGITRRKVLVYYQERGFEIREAYLRPRDLKGKLWLAGSGVGLLRTVGRIAHE